MSSSFITNKEKFLSDIINGILPKTDAVDFLVGYFYYSGYVQLSDNLKNKNIREVETFKQTLSSRRNIKEEYYYVKDVIIVTDKNKEENILKKLIALLNSKVMKYYYEKTFSTLHVQKDELVVLPIDMGILKIMKIK